jgi:glycolate oxidase FAD binding subunit
MAPASSAVERIAGRIREANESRRPLKLVGSGTWRSAPPADATTELSVRELDAVVDYVPGDLTITVGAGMPLSQLERLTAENGQWLTLDPHGSPDGTIGATIASASSGPMATAFGVPRDIVIGIEAVLGTGAIVRAGGRVVKNVAGFDLTRVLTGSRGTIGVITEVSLRLRARPAVDESVAITLATKPTAVRDAVATMRGWPAVPMAAELLAPRTAAALDLPETTTLLVRFGGNGRLVTAMKRRAAAVGKTAVVGTDIWSRYRQLDLDAPVCVRIIDLPTAFPERWDAALALAGEEGRVSASPLRGHLRCLMPAVERSAMSAFRGRVRSASVVFDALPTVAAWNSLTSVPAASTLHARIMEAFDPVGVMNPGAMRLAR